MTAFGDITEDRRAAMSAAVTRIEQVRTAGATVVGEIEQQAHEVADTAAAEAEKDTDAASRARGGWPASEPHPEVRLLHGLTDPDEPFGVADWRS